MEDVVVTHVKIISWHFRETRKAIRNLRTVGFPVNLFGPSRFNIFLAAEIIIIIIYIILNVRGSWS